MVFWPWYPRPPKNHLAKKQLRDPFESLSLHTVSLNLYLALALVLSLSLYIYVSVYLSRVHVGVWAAPGAFGVDFGMLLCILAETSGSL